MKKIALGIFDDHPLTGKGIAHFFVNETDTIEVSFIKNTKADLLAQLETQNPEILVLDIIAPEVNGLELFELLHKKYPKIKLIAYTSLSSPILVENLLAIGVKGYINKKQPATDLLMAVRMVNDNSIYVPDDYSHLIKKFREISNNNLSAREVEILKLIAQEKTSAKIAEELNLSINTIESHRKNIFYKLQVKNVAGMIMEAARLGYLS
ncbi:MAG: response regulator transcription factor [Bacteroidetes bacterium]|nr:response regulator transcription factor [Bacteroidota bacterium]